MEGVLRDLEYPDDLVLTSKTIESFSNEFRKCNIFQSDGFKVNPGRTKRMARRCVTIDSVSKVMFTHVASAAGE